MSLKKKLALHLQTGFLARFPDFANACDSMVNGPRQIGVYISIPTMLSANEREYLFQMARLNKPANAIVEIGCYSGGSAYFLSKGAEISGSRVFSIDPFDSSLERQVAESDSSSYGNKPSQDQIYRSLAQLGVNGRLQLIQGFAHDVAAQWTIPLGLIFIDGNHNSAYWDFLDWEPHISKHGRVLLHDANFPIHGKKKVTEDVDRILKERNWELVGIVDSIVCLERHR